MNTPVEQLRILGTVAELEASQVQESVLRPEDTLAILYDAHEDGETIQKLTRDRAEVSTILHPQALDPTEVAYPKLFGPDDHLEMARADLNEELEVIAGMGWPTTEVEPYLYNVVVLDPRDYRFAGSSSRYEAVLPLPAMCAELEVGHLHHEAFYGCDTSVRQQLFKDLLENAQLVRVSLQRPSGSYSVVDVTLSG